MKNNNYKSVIVSNIPEDLEEGVLYYSETFDTAIHKCMCGCGNEVVTPCSQSGWTAIINNYRNVSLTPSVGSFNLSCKSHYFLKNGIVKWV